MVYAGANDTENADVQRMTQILRTPSLLVLPLSGGEGVGGEAFSLHIYAKRYLFHARFFVKKT